MKGVSSIARIRMLMVALIIAVSTTCVSARKFAVKTNVISDATTSINLGGEMIVAPRWSVELSWQFNNWSFSEGKRWKHWFFQPEARYWFCDAIAGHFIGAHLIGGKYNFGHINLPFSLLGSDFRNLKDNRFQGWGAGAGIAYGYTWALAKHWNIEAEIGLGYIFTRYDRFECEGCGREVESNKTHNYFGPTKIALNLVYVF
ncbi:MAG: DUF3575 domain-containing protein [Muribaculaceae bacterium]|nr:DUF3575 domain-containing protein [Muribaculaceae bacterium]